MHRAATELAGGDSTLTIVLAAMAVESQLAYLFMKWNRVDLTLQRNPTDADEEEWEERWRDIRSVAARFDRVSSLLTGKSFDSFLLSNGDLLESVRTQYQSSGEALAIGLIRERAFPQTKSDRALRENRFSAIGS